MRGLIDAGAIPAEQVADILDAAKGAFVDGLNLAATVGAVIVVIAAIMVKRLLPSDRTSPEVTGEPETAPVSVD